MFDSIAWFEFCRSSEGSKGVRIVHTVSQSVIVPSVLLLREYDRILLQDMKFNRQNLLERDDFRCQYCGKVFAPKELNMDHVLPRDGVGEPPGKMWLLCIRCNSRKSNRLPNEAGMKLLKNLSVLPADLC